MSTLTSEERIRLINSIPQASTFDSHKENIMPRKEGRKATVMNGFMELSTSEKEQVLKKGHLNFKEELMNIDELDDPLAVYVNYIDWILDHYPQGNTKESNLLPTLKAATELFVNDTRYKQHPSYLKVCLRYAEWVEDPATIYRFLMIHEIGQNLALFYEVYAGYLERKSKYEDAEAVFQRGLNNNAQPKDRLERNLMKMKERIKERERKRDPTRPPQRNEQTTDGLKNAGRTMLGVKSCSESRSSQPSNIYNRTQSLYGSPTQSSSSSIGRNFSNTLPSTTRSKEAFEVYKEITTSSSDSTVLPSGVPKQLTVRSTLSHSENKARSDAYTGVTIKQAPFTPPPVQKFSIYRDNDSPSNSGPPSPTLAGGLSFTSEGSESSSIRKKPLSIELTTKKHKKAKGIPVSKANQERFDKYRNQYMESKDSQAKLEVIAAFKDHFTINFEEVRAERYLLTKKQQQQQQYHDDQPMASKTTIMDEDSESHHGEEFFDNNDWSIPEPSSPTHELTAETRFARESMDSFFGSNSVPDDDEDITWNKQYQLFKTPVRKNVDENEHP